MASTYTYDGFPLRRADKNTQGREYRFIIQSIDASIRHVLGVPADVSLSPPFAIDADGNVEFLKTFKIGSDVEIDEVISVIDDIPSADEDSQLVTVTGLRGYVDDAVEAAVEAADLWVLKAGDTMTGALQADGGVIIGAGQTLSSATQLDIAAATNIQLTPGDGYENLLSGHTALGAGWILKGYYGGVARAIAYVDDGDVKVGGPTTGLHLYGTGNRPLWNGADSIALVADLQETGMGGYVPVAGGTFTGKVVFEGGVQLDTGESLIMEDGGGNPYDVLSMDSFGAVEASAGSAQRWKFVGNPVQFDPSYGIYFGTDYLAEISGSDLNIGSYSHALNLVGTGTRPEWNSNELALLSDTLGSIQAGQGININDLGGSVYEIEVGDGEVVSSMISASGSENQVLSLDSGGDFDWHDTVQSITGGTGITASSGTGDVTVSVTAGSIGATQLGTNAVTQVKVADDAIGPDELTADNGSLEAGVDYFLTNNTNVLSWTDSRLTGVLGTLQIFMGTTNGVDQDTTSSDSYSDVFNETSGPYMIQRIWYTGTAGQGTEISVLCDGVEIIDDADNVVAYAASGDEHVGPDSVNDIKFPIFAKSSLQIRHKRRFGYSGGTTHAQVVRLG